MRSASAGSPSPGAVSDFGATRQREAGDPSAEGVTAASVGSVPAATAATSRPAPDQIEAGAGLRLSASRSARRRRAPLGLGGWIGIALTALLVLLAVGGPLLGLDPDKQNLLARLAPPIWAGGTAAHPLGTDQLGRDLLARVVAGARVSLLVGVVASLGAGLAGVALGLLAGAFGGRVDGFVRWLVDVQLAVPFVVVAIALAVLLGRGLPTLLVTLALTGWVGYARVVRLQARSVGRSAYVEAARALGATRAEVARRHLLPNVLAPILVLGSQQVAAMMLYEAALSYLGLGLGGKTVTWGGMVADGRDSLLVAPWGSIVPGAAIALAVVGLNLLGDALVDRGAAG